MVYRKGELSPAGVDRGWPYQVALDADLCSSENFDIHREFNKGLFICERGHSVSFGDKWYYVFCYLLKEDADHGAVRRRVVRPSGAGEGRQLDALAER